MGRSAKIKPVIKSNTEINFNNVSATESSIASVNVSNTTNYVMDFDLNGDDTTDLIIFPDSIITTPEQPQNNISILTYNGAGTINIATNIGNITSAANSNASLVPGKPDYEFPYGLLAFNISGLTNGSIVDLAIGLPHNLSSLAQYWKYGRTLDNNLSNWYLIPLGSNDDDNVITIKLQDGGIGDDDGIANGIISDAGGPSIHTVAIPIGSVESLQTSSGTNWLNFTWLNPPDPDFSQVMLYLKGSFKTSIPAPQNHYNFTGLQPDTIYELGTHTVDSSGNVNETWVNATARTLPSGSVPPVADCGVDKLKCENAGAKVQFNATGSYDLDGTISSYEWEFGDGATATGVAPNHTYATYKWNGSNYQSFMANLRVTDNSSLTNRSSQKVVIWIAGDANGDGNVNILDASVIGLKWNGNDPCADLNNDGVVNILDASIIGLNWGKSAIIGG